MKTEFPSNRTCRTGGRPPHQRDDPPETGGQSELSLRGSFWEKAIQQRQLLLMSLPIILYVILFFYVPLWGWTMAFQNFKPAKTFFAQEWVGLKWFKFLFADKVLSQDDPQFHRDELYKYIPGIHNGHPILTSLERSEKNVFQKDQSRPYPTCPIFSHGSS